MSISKVTYMLFDGYPREFGSPWRQICYDKRHLNKLISQHNGINDCFISVYDNESLIDKLFFDFDKKTLQIDNGNQTITIIIDSLDFAKKFYDFHYQNKLPIVPVISGKKGFHCYIPIKPDYYDAKTIREACFSLLETAGAYVEVEVSDKRDGKKKKYCISAADTTTFGDIRRLCRIPNTRRPDGINWCSYLPANWTQLKTSEIMSYMKAPHYFDYKFDYLPSLDSLIGDREVDFRLMGGKTESLPPELEEGRDLEGVDKLIKRFLKPCVYEEIIMRNPRNFIRLAATISLLKANFTTDEITNLLYRLNWIDRDYEYTNYQVCYIEENYKYEMSCERLQGQNAMCRSDCKHFNKKFG